MGVWTPDIKLDGTLDVQYRADSALINGINMEGTFTGSVVNRENIGKTGELLVERWNELNPQDQVG